tara:strand:+ start:1150 stop:3051 length:1902 start_codon:yes stop_codon:yes gene_type:complete
MAYQQKSYAFTGWVKQIINYIEGFNKQGQKNLSNEEHECLDCEVAAGAIAEDKGYMQQCVEQICPNEEYSYEKIYLNAYRRDVHKDKIYKEQVQPLINQIALLLAAEEKRSVSSVFQSIKRDDTIRNKNQIAFIRYFYAMRAMPESIGDYISIDANDDIAVNEEALRRDLSDKDKNKASVIADTIVTLVSYYRGILDYDKIALYSSKDLEEVIERALHTAKNNVLQIANTEGLSLIKKESLFKEILREEYLDVAATIEKLDEKTYNDIVSNGALSSILLHALKDNDAIKASQQSTIKISELVSADKIDLLKKVEKFSHNAHSSLSEHGRDYHSSECETAFAILMEYPSREEVDNFNLKGIKDQLKKTIKNKVSSESFSELNKRMDMEWQAAKTKSREQRIKEFVNGLIQTYEHEWIASKTEYSVDEQAFMSALYLSSVDLAEDEPEEVVLSSIKDYCEDITTNIIPDSALGKSSRFLIGPMTIRFPQEARGIIFHEMGHLLNYHFEHGKVSETTKKKVNKVNACLKNNHSYLSEQEKSSLTTKDGFLYQSEDFADLIAAKTTQLNTSCYARKHIETNGYEKLDLRNHDEEDTHSSKIYRLLHMQYLQQGEIPEVCDLALEQRGQKAAFKDCWQ